MKKLAVSALALFFACAGGVRLSAQIAAATLGSPTPAKKAEKAKPKDKKKEDKSSTTNLFGSSAAGLQTNEPVTTEIYSDEAFFDSTKNMGIFSGRVKVIDPRFNLQSDKLTVFITKGQNQSLGVWKEPLQKEMLDWCVNGQTRRVERPLVRLAEPIRPFIRLQLEMLN